MRHTARTSTPLRHNQRSARHKTIERTYLVEVWDIGNIYEVDDCKVLHFLCNRVERLVHRHALLVPIVTKADYDDTILFRFDGFIDMPAAGKVGKEVGHVWSMGELGVRHSHKRKASHLLQQLSSTPSFNHANPSKGSSVVICKDTDHPSHFVFPLILNIHLQIAIKACIYGTTLLTSVTWSDCRPLDRYTFSTKCTRRSTTPVTNPTPTGHKLTFIFQLRIYT